jgi:hypothetical protein
MDDAILNRTLVFLSRVASIGATSQEVDARRVGVLAAFGSTRKPRLPLAHLKSRSEVHG